jgi:uncharacterized protein (TIGR02453 family)
MNLLMIENKTFEFLQDLSKNNEKSWFDNNRTRYESGLNNVKAFAQETLELLRKYDEIETISGAKSLHRIYRDVRFSHDKTPYKTHWSGSFRRAGKYRRGGFYMHIEPGNSFTAGGFWGPSPGDLRQLRAQIAAEPDRMRKIIQDKAFKSYFGELRGEQVKTAPKGYSSDHEAIDLLRYKQFLLSHKISDKELMSANAPKLIVEGFVKMLPFFNLMSEYLTQDLNGTPIPENLLP